MTVAVLVVGIVVEDMPGNPVFLSKEENIEINHM